MISLFPSGANGRRVTLIGSFKGRRRRGVGRWAELLVPVWWGGALRHADGYYRLCQVFILKLVDLRAAAALVHPITCQVLLQTAAFKYFPKVLCPRWFSVSEESLRHQSQSQLTLTGLNLILFICLFNLFFTPKVRWFKNCLNHWEWRLDWNWILLLLNV